MGEKGGWENFPIYLFLFCFVEGNKKKSSLGVQKKKNEGEITKKKKLKKKRCIIKK